MNDDFNKNGFYVYKNALSLETCEVISGYYHYMVKSGYDYRDTQVPDAITFGQNHAIQESVSEIIYKKYNKLLSSIDLQPTYSYGRYYLNNNILDAHKDRTACELSATLTVDYDEEWPICLEDNNGKSHSINLNRGDLIFYRGCDLTHWRDAFSGQYAIQIFLHYINKNNPEIENEKMIRDKEFQESLYRKYNTKMLNDNHTREKI